MAPHYRHLSMDERRKIYQMLGQECSIAEIADALNRHPSTIYRELSRNCVKPDRENRSFRYWEYQQSEGYFPVTADRLAHKRRERLRKLESLTELRYHVVEKLKCAWSPEQIAGRLKYAPQAGIRISHETIYRFAYSDNGKSLGLPQLLPCRHRQRRPRYGRKPRQSFVPKAFSIENRPKLVDSRSAFGHWEADLVIFKRAHGKTNLTSMIERQSRYTQLIRNPDRQSKPLVSSIARALQAMPNQACQTMTFDRGTEFASYDLLKKTKGLDSYFCDPHSPWQKGGVENLNGRIRRFLPLETNLAELSKDELDAICTKLNDTPRKCLGYRTPNEVFHQQLALIETRC